MWSFDFGEIEALQHAGWYYAGAETIAAAHRPERGGADLVANFRRRIQPGAVIQAGDSNLRRSNNWGQITATSGYEPGIIRTYQNMATHYGTAILPARVRRSRDKAEVEVAVQVVQRWVLARLRHWRFFSLAELNGAIRELIVDLNDRPMPERSGRSAPARRRPAPARLERGDG